MVDEKARKILFETYWSSAGWKNTRLTDPADFDYARQAGYMFDDARLTHDDIVAKLLSIRDKVRLEKVAEAFLASLSTRRPDLRSALGSYSFASHFPDHRLTALAATSVPSGRLHCHICGLYGSPVAESEDLNILSFKRWKWGGVRHTDPLYCWFDLSRFEATPAMQPRGEDYAIMARIVAEASSLASNAKPNELEKRIGKLIRSNAAERRVLIEILGYCGILKPAGRCGFLQAFTSAKQTNSDLPPDGRNDWEYPAIWWRGADGVNGAVLAQLFPEVAAMVDIRLP
jgi:hypothetical protein